MSAAQPLERSDPAAREAFDRVMEMRGLVASEYDAEVEERPLGFILLARWRLTPAHGFGAERAHPTLEIAVSKATREIVYARACR